MNQYGFGRLLTMGFGTPKLKKSDKSGLGFKSAIQYFSPHKSSGVNLCPAASLGCIKGCLNTAGRGKTNSVQKARMARTKCYNYFRDSYKILLTSEVIKFVKKCKKLGQTPAMRLNGTSDIKWEIEFPGLINSFQDVQFYDYTKIFPRMMRYIGGELPVNYHLTFSRSETNNSQCMEVLRAGGNVAVVFRTDHFPRTWNRFRVFNAELHDLRFLDPRGVAGLKAKGRAVYDTTGFVVNA